MSTPTIAEKIKSLGEQIGAVYKKPSPEYLRHLQQMLLGSDTAMEYLSKVRNLTMETIQHFGLGFDTDKQAIAIPVYKRGELVNIKYRFLNPDGAKYIGTTGAEVWLYNDDGIEEAKKKSGVLIVEGEFDCMSVWQAGIKNVISPASGKDSYGMWLELLDNIPRVYIAYDNDEPGRATSLKLAERVGLDKCLEVLYTEDIKDANEYFKKHSPSDFRSLIRTARPFYKHQFSGLVDIINMLRGDTSEKITLQFLPDVKIKPWWTIILSGKANAGKTSYVLNLVSELMDKKIPVLVLPFERGPQDVGGRYLQVRYGYSEGDFMLLGDTEWGKIIEESIDAPLYFAMPSRDKTIEIIRRAKRIFNVKAVVIDHLDLMVRSANKGNYERDLADTIQALHAVGQEEGIILLIVHHVRKVDTPGAKLSRAPGMEDLKGSSALYQDPECVVMLSAPDAQSLLVNVVKNKGVMNKKVYGFNKETGKLQDIGTLPDESEDLWNSIPSALETSQ